MSLDNSENDTLSGMVDQPTNSGESDMDVTENEDGSATVIERKEEVASARDFYRNLAEDLEDSVLDEIATDLLDKIDRDKESRRKRDEQYKDGVQRMGLDKDTPGGANFTGASNVVHPMYIKACVDFEARAIKEILPPGGPVREYIAGTVTAERADRAKRKAKWMNYQITQQMPGFRSDFEQLLMQLPMGGNQYFKLFPPYTRKKFRIKHEWIPVDDMLLPFSATSFYTAERRTHRQEITEQEFANRIRSGMYKYIDIYAPQRPEKTKTGEIMDKVEGKEEPSDNTDGIRIVYECDCIYEVPDPDVPGSGNDEDESGVGEDGEEVDAVGPLPYIIHIDETSRKIVGLYRNWDERDEDERDQLQWTVDFSFVPFRGAYSLGLPHMVGGLSIATTGALRALLDKAHIANFPGMIKLKGQSGTAQTLRVSPTEVTEIEGSGEQDDIRKLIMPLPYGEPSGVLFQLLGFLATQGEAVIKTTVEEANDNANVPVGTTLARIEQGLVAFSAVHGRLHDSMDRLLKILHRINATFLEDEDVMEALGEQLVTKDDFDTASDVIPVSDPNIFCEVQRFGQIQSVAQRAEGAPDIYDRRKVEELILKQLKLPNDGKDLLIPKPEPKQLNPVNENVALALGRPIVAFPQQDHEAHINTHCDFFDSPVFSTLVASNPASLSGLIQNLSEHLAFWYATRIHDIASKAAGVDIGTLPQQSEKDPELSHKYDIMLSEASIKVMEESNNNQAVKRAVMAVSKLKQQMQQMQPPPPMDPTQAAMADVKRQAEKDRADQQIKTQDIQSRQQVAQQSDATKLQIANAQEAAANQRTEEQGMVKQQITQADNETAVGIAQFEAAVGHKSNIKNGEAVGKRDT